MKRCYLRQAAIVSFAVLLLLLPFASGQPVGVGAHPAVATSVSFTALPPQVVARLTANPPKYRGHCPARITFNGEIIAPPGVTSGAVGTFRFVRSDGHQSPVRRFNAGSSNPSTTWSVGGRSTRRFSGWVQIQILTPSPLTSPKAEFTVECY